MEIKKGLAAMLVIKSSAGVAPEVILWNPLHKREEAGKQGIHYDFESQCRQHKKCTTGVSVAPLKGLMSSNFFKKNPSVDSVGRVSVKSFLHVVQHSVIISDYKFNRLSISYSHHSGNHRSLSFLFSMAMAKLSPCLRCQHHSEIIRMLL